MCGMQCQRYLFHLFGICLRDHTLLSSEYAHTHTHCIYKRTKWNSMLTGANHNCDCVVGFGLFAKKKMIESVCLWLVTQCLREREGGKEREREICFNSTIVSLYSRENGGTAAHCGSVAVVIVVATECFRAVDNAVVIVAHSCTATVWLVQCACACRRCACI